MVMPVSLNVAWWRELSCRPRGLVDLAAFFMAPASVLSEAAAPARHPRMLAIPARAHSSSCSWDDAPPTPQAPSIWPFRKIGNPPRIRTAGTPCATTLLRPRQARLRHDLAPSRDLGVDEALELLRRGDAARDHAQLDDLLLNVGQCHDGGERGLQLAHDLLARAGRHREHAPAGGVESGNAG